jgi:UDP-glucose 4-epimerase
VEVLRADARGRALEDVFRRRGVGAVLHMGLMHNPRNDVGCYRFNVVGTQRLLEMVTKFEVPRLVMLSSANIYGPDPDNSHFLTEEAPLLGAEHHSEIRDLVAVDNLVQSFFYRQPEICTVLLRPVHIVGPRVRNAPANYLRLERPWVLAGFDPLVQLIHEEDVVDAMRLALETEARGVYNVVGPEVAPLSRVLRVLGRRPRVVPSPIARPMLESAWRMRATSFPPPELRHVQYNCVVDGTEARQKLGFEPSFGLAETIRSVVENGASPG